MTKKDYELIAQSVRRTLQVVEFTEKNQVKRIAKQAVLKLVANDLAGSLYGDNPRFDRDRFLTACGINDLDSWEQQGVNTFKQVMNS